MDLIDKLFLLVTSHSLSCGEEEVAKALTSLRDIKVAFNTIATSDLVTSPSVIIGIDISKIIIQLIRVPCYSITCFVPPTESFDVAEVAMIKARTVGNTLQKLLGHHVGQLKGSIYGFTGVLINGTGCPGPLIWKLLMIPQLEIHIENWQVVLSFTYYDLCTKTSRCETKTLPLQILDRKVGGLEFQKILQDYLFPKLPSTEGPLSASFYEIILHYPFAKVNLGSSSSTVSEINFRADRV